MPYHIYLYISCIVNFEELEMLEDKDFATSSEVYLFFLGTTAYIETYLELSQSFVEC